MEITRENEHPIEGENHGGMAPFLMSEEEKRRSEKEAAAVFADQTEPKVINNLTFYEQKVSHKLVFLKLTVKKKLSEELLMRFLTRENLINI